MNRGSCKTSSQRRSPRDRRIPPGFATASLDQRLEGVKRQVEGVEQRLAGVGQQLEGVRLQLEGVEHKIDEVNRQVDGIKNEGISEIRRLKAMVVCVIVVSILCAFGLMGLLIK